jgi:hypothetical protein
MPQAQSGVRNNGIILKIILSPDVKKRIKVDS